MTRPRTTSSEGPLRHLLQFIQRELAGTRAYDAILKDVQTELAHLHEWYALIPKDELQAAKNVAGTVGLPASVMAVACAAVTEATGVGDHEFLNLKRMDRRVAKARYILIRLLHERMMVRKEDIATGLNCSVSTVHGSIAKALDCPDLQAQFEKAATALLGTVREAAA